jgi:outer membrane murein-binding lipoprotein Lpp
MIITIGVLLFAAIVAVTVVSACIVAGKADEKLEEEKVNLIK